MTKKIILGTSLTTVLGILIYISTLQGVIITTSGDITCKGTLDNPCISYFNITSNYYTLKFFNNSNQKLTFSPDVKDYKIYRFTYGKWKEIKFPINMTKGTKYQFKLIGYKNNPYENIKWGIKSGDTEIDPIWHGIKEAREKMSISTVQSLDWYYLEKDSNYDLTVNKINKTSDDCIFISVTLKLNNTNKNNSENVDFKFNKTKISIPLTKSGYTWERTICTPQPFYNLTLGFATTQLIIFQNSTHYIINDTYYTIRQRRNEGGIQQYYLKTNDTDYIGDKQLMFFHTVTGMPQSLGRNTETNGDCYWLENDTHSIVYRLTCNNTDGDGDYQNFTFYHDRNYFDNNDTSQKYTWYFGLAGFGNNGSYSNGSGWSYAEAYCNDTDFPMDDTENYYFLNNTGIPNGKGYVGYTREGKKEILYYFWNESITDIYTLYDSPSTTQLHDFDFLIGEDLWKHSENLTANTFEWGRFGYVTADSTQLGVKNHTYINQTYLDYWTDMTVSSSVGSAGAKKGGIVTCKPTSSNCSIQVSNTTPFQNEFLLEIVNFTTGSDTTLYFYNSSSSVPTANNYFGKVKNESGTWNWYNKSDVLIGELGVGWNETGIYNNGVGTVKVQQFYAFNKTTPSVYINVSTTYTASATTTTSTTTTSTTTTSTTTTSTIPMSLSVQMPQTIINSIEDITTDSNASNTVWNKNHTIISGGYTPVIIYGNISINNASQSSWNESFTGNQNNIFYIRIKQTSNVTFGTLNISGFNSSNVTNSLNTLAIVENFEKSSDYYTKSSGCSIPITTGLHHTEGANSTLLNRTNSGIGICSYSYKEDTWDNTTSIADLMDDKVEVCVDVWVDSRSGIDWITVALTDFEDINYISWKYEDLSPGENYLCWNFSSYDEKSGDITLANSTEINFYVNTVYFPLGNPWIYIDNLRISNYTFPHNPHLDVGNDNIWNWNYTGIFNVTNNKTYDFSSDMRDYISDCSPDIQGYCNVPFVLHSDKGGMIQINAINITYVLPTSNWTINPPRYWWGKFNITNLTYFDTATLNIFKQPILDTSWGNECNITKPCVTNSYYSLNQTWKGITWNNQPSWLNYIMEKKNITSNIGKEQFNITNNLKSVFNNATFMIRIPMQDIGLKSINITKSGYLYPIAAYYRPYIYSSTGNATNSTSAFDYNYNDTSTKAEVRNSSSEIQYWFDIGTNKFNGTLFFTYLGGDQFTGTPGKIQIFNTTNDWFTAVADNQEPTVDYENIWDGENLLGTTLHVHLLPKYIDSTGRVKLRIIGGGSFNSITLQDAYISINDMSSGPFINASVTKYLMNESSCVSLGNMSCYQNGTFAPKGQTNSQWIFNITNVGNVNGSVYANWTQNLPSCMTHYLSRNYTLEPSVDYNVSTVSNVTIGSINTSQNLTYWGFFVLRNCTPGYWINSTLIFGG